MAVVLPIIGVIAGAVGAVAGTLGTLGIISAGLASTIVGVASVVSAIAGLGAMIFKPKPPPARGSVTRILVDPDAPAPYAMGEGPVGGVLRHDAAYGATLDKVPNPYRWLVTCMSVAGPIQSITPWADLAAVGSYYSGYLYTSTQLGAVPESAALSPHYSGPPGWSSSSKLSGKAAIGWNLLFDRNGKVFSSGIPKLAGYGQWVKVYDPRLDSTFSGGSGSHRFDDETTWTWSENPALHALAYARGRFVSGKKVMGVGLPKEALDIVTVAAWANVCDANSWKIFGVCFEPGDRWANLKDICIAGGAEAIFAGGLLSFKYAAPKVALDTVTEDDIADAAMSVVPMASWRERINTVIPKYRSPAHDWELVDADPVSVSSYVTQDGETKKVNWPFNFVKSVNQAAQLARYRLEDSREIVPIQITVKPRLRAYRPGECLHLTLPQLGLNHDCIILKREIDPATMTVKLTLMTETSGKHTFALGMTGTAPATPALVQDQPARDTAVAASSEYAADITSAIAGPAEITINADHTGAITDTLPVTANFTLLKDGVDQTTSATWTITGLAGTFSASIGSSTGVASITTSAGSLTSGRVLITATLDGRQRAIEVIVTKKVAGAPYTGTGGGSSAFGSVTGTTSSTSYVAVGDELTVTVGSLGHVDLSAWYNFTGPSGTLGEYARWYRWNGSSYVAIGTATLNMDDFVAGIQVGYGECNFTDTGRTPATSEKYRLYAANSSGTVTRTFTGGSVSAVGS